MFHRWRNAARGFSLCILTTVNNLWSRPHIYLQHPHLPSTQGSPTLMRATSTASARYTMVFIQQPPQREGDGTPMSSNETIGARADETADVRANANVPTCLPGLFEEAGTL